MHDRYDDPRIVGLWSDMSLLNGWLKVEMAVMQARVERGEMPLEAFEAIKASMDANPIDVDWWKRKEEETKHDLNAFLQERLRFIEESLRHWFHKGMTSFDTEESAFVQRLLDSAKLLLQDIIKMKGALRDLAIKYRYTPMMAVTHGQWADVQTFGKRALTWYKDLETAEHVLQIAIAELRYSKLSGFVGNYTDIDPKLEAHALKLLGFEPYHGATQILPRVMFRPLASAIGGVSKILNKIALDIRLGARSASVLYQEPFSPRQMGSSAGPQKRNTIGDEQVWGMDALVSGFEAALHAVEVTWEERAIEQSCVERIAWRDLYHAVIREIKVMTKITTDLVVYPQNMMREIVMTNGCYAASVAKEVLRDLAAEHGLSANDCYRLVQLAAFNLGYPELDSPISQSLAEASEAFYRMQQLPLEPTPRGNIRDIIRQGQLQPCEILAPTEEQITGWNEVLLTIFADEEICRRWDEVFSLQHLLRNEDYLFEQVFGI